MKIYLVHKTYLSLMNIQWNVVTKKVIVVKYVFSFFMEISLFATKRISLVILIVFIMILKYLIYYFNFIPYIRIVGSRSTFASTLIIYLFFLVVLNYFVNWKIVIPSINYLKTIKLFKNLKLLIHLFHK